ncbi:N-acetyltransferase [Rheinheimera sediminis]|uniref:GNAT family N-acetyltransferase n=1 Tax=Rheinheimera sp. YQF-1 TaxID=2499626 RepID=UPI000FDAE217|nr:GNAT family N-acetyltransferase [Rheinheimera sp. YQF-1]RVT49028.1 N-acetyltransferase [Rheinheimera sp. YQF-1]
MIVFEKQDVSRSFRLPSVVKKEVRRLSPQSEYERNWLRACFQQAESKETTLYYAKALDTQNLIGIFSLSISKPDNRTSWMVIEYLYVLPDFRGQYYEQSQFKASELIVAEIILLARKISSIVNLELIALQLAHDRLQPSYENMGFVVIQRATKKHNEVWMATPVI